ncbi:hypothetical protein MMC25_002502 [Agyrium rufum]|nr:hypothetical protein [Agyrium rufum]
MTSREERFLMKQRGAGVRPISGLNFEFGLSKTPGRRRKTLEPPATTRKTPKPVKTPRTTRKAPNLADRDVQAINAVNEFRKDVDREEEAPRMVDENIRGSNKRKAESIATDGEDVRPTRGRRKRLLAVSEEAIPEDTLVEPTQEHPKQKRGRKRKVLDAIGDASRDDAANQLPAAVPGKKRGRKPKTEEVKPEDAEKVEENDDHNDADPDPVDEAAALPTSSLHTAPFETSLQATTPTRKRRKKRKSISQNYKRRKSDRDSQLVATSLQHPQHDQGNEQELESPPVISETARKDVIQQLPKRRGRPKGLTSKATEKKDTGAAVRDETEASEFTKTASESLSKVRRRGKLLTTDPPERRAAIASASLSPVPQEMTQPREGQPGALKRGSEKPTPPPPNKGIEPSLQVESTIPLKQTRGRPPGAAALSDKPHPRKVAVTVPKTVKGRRGRPPKAAKISETEEAPSIPTMLQARSIPGSEDDVEEQSIARVADEASQQLTPVDISHSPNGAIASIGEDTDLPSTNIKMTENAPVQAQDVPFFRAGPKKLGNVGTAQSSQNGLDKPYPNLTTKEMTPPNSIVMLSTITNDICSSTADRLGRKINNEESSSRRERFGKAKEFVEEFQRCLDRHLTLLSAKSDRLLSARRVFEDAREQQILLEEQISRVRAQREQTRQVLEAASAERVQVSPEMQRKKRISELMDEIQSAVEKGRRMHLINRVHRPGEESQGNTEDPIHATAFSEVVEPSIIAS